MKIIYLLLTSLLSFTVQAGFQEGIDAVKNGDYKTAIYNYKKALDEEDEGFKPLINKYLATAYYRGPDDVDSDFKLAFKAFNESSKRYSWYIHSILGSMYLFGQGTDKDLDKAREHFELSNKYSDTRMSLWMLGKIYLHGHGVKKDYQKAKEYFDRSVAVNSSSSGNAQFELAHLYEYGKGVDKDLLKALEHYQKAAKQGDADAQYKFDLHTGKISQSERNVNFEKALDHTYGYTGSINYDKAIKYYQLAADEGHSTSIYNIGYLLTESSPIKRYTEAANYFEKAANLGNVYAQSSLASIYFSGKGVEKDLEKAFYWEKKAAELGHLDSVKEIAYSYYKGYGVAKNFKHAVTWYQKAIDMGDRESIFDLASMYENGEGVDEDFDKALELYIQAAELGYDAAQNELADIYFKGKEVDKDYKKSFYWAKKAAEQGYDDAQHKIGIFYLAGKGVVEVDMDEAFKWFKQAADQGSTKSYNGLAELYAKGYGVKKNAKESLKWYKKSATLGDKVAQYKVGYHYDYGIVVQKDVNEAIKWYKKSVKKKYRKAQIAMGKVYYYGDKGSNIPKNYKKAADWFYKAAKNTKKEEDSVEIKVTSSGSGFFVTPNHIITNNHVTAGCDAITVKNKGYESNVKLLDTDSTTDLSILVTGKPNKSFLYLRNRKPVVTGEQSIALGYPFSSTLGSELKVTSGNIAALTGIRNNIAKLQLTSPVQPGNSGGPLLDDNGNVIGIIVSRLEKSKEITGNRTAQNVNFAIKTNMAKIFMDLNMIDYQVRKANGSMPVSQIVTEAKEATVQVICKEE